MKTPIAYFGLAPVCAEDMANSFWQTGKLVKKCWRDHRKYSQSQRGTGIVRCSELLGASLNGTSYDYFRGGGTGDAALS